MRISPLAELSQAEQIESLRADLKEARENVKRCERAVARLKEKRPLAISARTEARKRMREWTRHSTQLLALVSLATNQQPRPEGETDEQ